MKDYRKQQGAALAVSLIILLVLTFIGIASIRAGIFQHKMTANLHDKERSFEAAEAALLEGENWLMALATAPVPLTTCTTQPCVLDNSPTRYPETAAYSWWNANSAAASTMITGVSALPQYLIEYSRFVPDNSTIGQGYNTAGSDYYRVIARGSGRTSNAKSYLESTVAKRN